MKKDNFITKKIRTFFLIEISSSFIFSIPLFILKAKDNSSIVIAISLIFMVLPFISVLITKKITKDKSKLPINFKLKGNIKYYLSSMFLPSILTIIGVIIYFIIFPSHFDLTLSYMKELSAISNQEFTMQNITISMVIIGALALMLFAPFVFINHIFAFGEEIGWRGYILPLLMEKYGTIKGILINGVLWGIVHAPIVCFGLNYTGNYIGRPFTGILMMIMFASSIGVFLSYLTIKSKSVIPACIAHGVINAIREAPLIICNPLLYNVLLGPKPSGLIGMLGFIIFDVILLLKLKKESY